MNTITETCSCGSKIQVEGEGTTKAIERWRRHHQRCREISIEAAVWDRLRTISPPPQPIVISPPPPAAPSPHWWQNPVTYSTTTDRVEVHNHPAEVQ